MIKRGVKKKSKKHICTPKKHRIVFWTPKKRRAQEKNFADIHKPHRHHHYHQHDMLSLLFSVICAPTLASLLVCFFVHSSRANRFRFHCDFICEQIEHFTPCHHHNNVSCALTLFLSCEFAVVKVAWLPRFLATEKNALPQKTMRYQKPKNMQEPQKRQYIAFCRRRHGLVELDSKHSFPYTCVSVTYVYFAAYLKSSCYLPRAHCIPHVEVETVTENTQIFEQLFGIERPPETNRSGRQWKRNNSDDICFWQL